MVLPQDVMKPGSVLAHPDGDATVLVYDALMDVITTTRGKFGFEEIEELDDPDWRDQEAVETWLRLSGRIVPHARISTETTRCKDRDDCSCTLCYVVEMFDLVGEVVDKHHWMDAPACRCTEKGCSCVG